MKYLKKPIPVMVEFAQQSGELKTLEGSVRYEAGDALMTGAVGEHWPISRSCFEATYDPIPPTRMGEKGNYMKKPTPIHARQAAEEERITLTEGKGILLAKVGDWIVTDPAGHQWVVADEIFSQTYQITE